MPFKIFEIASLIIFVVKLNLTFNYTFAPSNLFCVAGRMRKRTGLDFFDPENFHVFSLFLQNTYFFAPVFRSQEELELGTAQVL